MTADPTHVYLTVDVECAEQRRRPNGESQPAQGYDLRVWGRFENQSRELGIPLIMDTLERFGMRGTFFTEVLGSHYFGKGNLATVCQAMLRRGHDVQLHLHPVQREPLLVNGQPSAPDNLADYPIAEQVELLREGISLLAAAGVPTDTITAFRAGNFGANNETWQAMAQVGLKVSSNYNPCYFENGCDMRSDAFSAGPFESKHPGLWELPIQCFKDPTGKPRHLQITAASRAETIHCLKAMRAAGGRHVTIVTHPFEYFTVDSIEKKTAHPNHINVHRLTSLLKFIADNPQDFVVSTVHDFAQSLPSRPCPVDRLPCGTQRHYWSRIAQQAVKRVAERIPI